MTLVDSTSVVVGVDNSHTAMRATFWAADVAQQMNAPLVIAHGVTIPGWYLSEASLLATPSIAQAEEAAERLVTRIREEVAEQHPELEIHTVIKPGPADLMLIALSGKARLLVVGAHRTATAQSLMVGSTASLVANHAPCPVVIWRPGAGHRRVVVGVDGSPLSEAAVEHAFEFASWFGAELEAVHAWSESRIWEEEKFAQENKALLSESLAGWSEKYPDVHVKSVSTPGDPRDLLSEMATNARLVVVGSHGRGRAGALILGSVSAHLIKHAPCPVMVCRGS
ncbi:MAG: universal stress protein [Nocardiaceae bacterium]|nr:universal stress protein [Nocardiaceae bacterium]